MLERDKNTDNLFRTGLTNFSASPPASVWTNIENGLDAKKQDKRIFFFWRGLAAASVLLVIGYSLMILFNQTNPEALNIASSIHSKSSTHNHASENKTDKTNNHQITHTHNAILSSGNDVEKQNNQINTTHVTKTTAVTSFEKTSNNLSFINGKGLPLLATNFSYASTQLKSKPQSLYTSYPIMPPTSKVRNKRTRILLGGAVSPTYSGNGSYQGGGSGDMYADATTNSSYQSASDINKKGITSISGGLNIRFENDTRWSFETGVHYSKVGEIAENNFSYSRNALSSDTEETHILQYIYLNNSIGQIKLKDNGLNKNQTNINEVLSDANALYASEYYANSSTDIKLTLEYIEIPLNVRYKIFSGFPTVSLSGGISSNFLIGHNAYLINEKTETKIGETNNIKPLIFSSSIGLGLELPIGKSFRFSLEPKLKYFLDSVNSDSNYSYQPVSLGIFGGIILIVN